MWNTNFYKRFFQKYFVVHEQPAVESSFSSYVCYALDGLFWLNLYLIMANNDKGYQFSLVFFDSKNSQVVDELRLATILCDKP